MSLRARWLSFVPDRPASGCWLWRGLICAELEREGMTAPPEYIRPSRVAPVDMPAQHMEF